ncbi:MAG: branched-chain amino acid ABC transporter permease [OCS116 cluster bacterium]|uniref:Branched-chain amino acid ABC transporter permease n=1 Tax=OCS116 cluster bacterium TaxID=2030921 RepID=A0A2A4Z0B1_9PROT|nr:branched-chain amino acid ABC transporter permease [OCS116 cluster bacterium]
MILKSLPKKQIRVFLVLTLITIILASAPWWVSRADIRLLGEFYSFLALAVLWNLLAGYTGLISVGQQAFVGVGGYAMFIVTAKLGISPFLSVPISMLAAALIAGVFAPLLFRLNGAHFAIGTWVAAETISLCFFMVPELGGGAGMSLPTDVVKSIASSRAMREMTIYWLMLGLGLGTIFAVYALLLSKTGLALMALRDNEIAAASLGINIWKTKFVMYIAVAAATGAIGAVIFFQKLRISPESAFSLNDWTIIIIFIVVIGGIGKLEGAIVGTIVFFILRETLADYGVVYLIVLGVFAIIIMMFSRKGIWGMFEEKFKRSLLPVTREP